MIKNSYIRNSLKHLAGKASEPYCPECIMRNSILRKEALPPYLSTHQCGTIKHALGFSECAELELHILVNACLNSEKEYITKERV